MRRTLRLSDDAVPKPAAIDPALDEDSISALISFFELLDKSDQEQARKLICNPKSAES